MATKQSINNEFIKAMSNFVPEFGNINHIEIIRVIGLLRTAEKTHDEYKTKKKSDENIEDIKKYKKRIISLM